jgi:uncharacterized protein YkwD
MNKGLVISLGLWTVYSFSLLVPIDPLKAQSNPSNFESAKARCDAKQILTARSCPGDGLGLEEKKLYDLINKYRAQNGLSPIPLSPSLMLVANRHVQDLDMNVKKLTHGWSNCPYNLSNPSTHSCMWGAPQRLGTPYPGYGYENAYRTIGKDRATANDALQAWKGSSVHNGAILNQGMWQRMKWNALGIGIYKGYAVLWFGEQPDPASARR